MRKDKLLLSQVKSDWPPLHVAAMHGDSQKINFLLGKGLNLLQKDSQGFTAIHRLLGTENAKSQSARILLASDQLEECKVQRIGLTHLHVASWLNNAKAVQRLLEQGSNIEATIERVIEDKNLAKFAGCTPLHVAMLNQSTEAVKELLQWGADMFAKKPGSISPLVETLNGGNEKMLNLFVLLLWSDNELQQSMKMRESGLTMLHIACHMLDTKKVKTLLKNKVDVNARIHEDSNVWPGCTPSHVLIPKADKLRRGSINRRKRFNMFYLLLANGADVTVADVRQCTPLQVMFEGGGYDLMNSILKQHLDFRVNPTDNLGLSYFHLACLTNDLESVEKFLQQGSVDVNRPINFNSSVYAGSTPLHLAVEGMRRFTVEDYKVGKFHLRVVESLLSHGAKVSLKDSQGDTPLHKVMRFFWGSTTGLSLMKKLLGLANATDVNIRNTSGKTPMEILLANGAGLEQIKLLLDHGGCINACNPTTNEGYIALIFSLWRYNKAIRQATLSMILKSAELSKLDEMGRNAIHNAVTAYNMSGSMNDLIGFITELIKLDCDIDHRDNFGKTALHLAVQFRNVEAVHSLLMLGADFNVVDLSGKSAYSYVFDPAVHQQMYEIESRERLLRSIFVKLVQKFKFVGIEVSGLNDVLQIKAIQNYKIVTHSIVNDNFFVQLRATENVKLGPRELTLRSFLCETGAISIYPSITPTGRQEIAAFFENYESLSFPQLVYLIKFQYRKAVARLPLVASARDALKILYRFPLPDLCVQIVLMYLSNSELKNLIAASIDVEDTQMMIDE